MKAGTPIGFTPSLLQPTTEAHDDEVEEFDAAEPQEAAKCPFPHEWFTKMFSSSKAKSADMPGAKYKLEQISCPYLATQVNTGRLTPNPETGYISNADAMANLKANGFDNGAAAFFVDAADKADAHPDGFSLYEMRHNSLNHKGSSRTRDAGFNPEALKELLAFGNADGRFYKANFAAAARHFASNGTGEGSKLGGTFVVNIEYSSTLQVFGRTDDKGDKYMTVDDLKRLFIDNLDPVGWAPPPPEAVTKGTLFGGAFNLAALRIWEWVRSLFSF